MRREKQTKDHRPDPDGAVVDADDPFGFFHAPPATLGPVVVGEAFGIPKTGPIGVLG